jgi:hypothetical protein
MKSTASAPIHILTAALICGALIADVDAARQLPNVWVERQQMAPTVVAYSTLHKRVWSTTAAAWTEQLPSGPSPRGPGH